MFNFCKSLNCPTSAQLVRFEKGEASPGLREKITRHIRFCEFCAAETEFYAQYPLSDERVVPEKIPTPLLELAEALLTDKHKDDFFLAKLLGEKDTLALKKA